MSLVPDADWLACVGIVWDLRRDILSRLSKIDCTNVQLIVSIQDDRSVIKVEEDRGVSSLKRWASLRAKMQASSSKTKPKIVGRFLRTNRKDKIEPNRHRTQYAQGDCVDDKSSYDEPYSDVGSSKELRRPNDTLDTAKGAPQKLIPSDNDSKDIDRDLFQPESRSGDDSNKEWGPPNYDIDSGGAVSTTSFHNSKDTNARGFRLKITEERFEQALSRLKKSMGEGSWKHDEAKFSKLDSIADVYCAAEEIGEFVTAFLKERKLSQEKQRSVKKFVDGWAKKAMPFVQVGLDLANVWPLHM